MILCTDDRYKLEGYVQSLTTTTKIFTIKFKRPFLTSIIFPYLLRHKWVFFFPCLSRHKWIFFSHASPGINEYYFTMPLQEQLYIPSHVSPGTCKFSFVMPLRAQSFTNLHLRCYSYRLQRCMQIKLRMIHLYLYRIELIISKCSQSLLPITWSQIRVDVEDSWSSSLYTFHSRLRTSIFLFKPFSFLLTSALLSTSIDFVIDSFQTCFSWSPMLLLLSRYLKYETCINITSFLETR